MPTKSLFLSIAVLALSLTAAKAQIFSNGLLALDGSNIENSGTFDYAYNFDFNSTAATVTINGVTFTGFNVNTDTSANFSIINTGMDGTGGGSAPDGTDSNYSAAVQLLNEHGAFGNSTLTLKGLTAGVSYSLQLIVDGNSHDDRQQAYNDSTNGPGPFPQSATVFAGGNQNPANATFAHGPYDIPYVTDTFTATGSTETINALIGGGAGSQLSGFVLETTPEPSTWAMMALAFGGLAIVLRKRAILRS